MANPSAAPLLAGLKRASIQRVRGRHLVRRLNLALAVAWALMIPIAILTGWIYSIAFISAASIYANFISHIAAWRADVPTDEH
jgi:hypothetical protein